MGIFGPSKRERDRLEKQYWAVHEYENSLKQGIQFVRDKPKIMEIIEPGLKSKDAKKVLDACTQAYAMVYSLRYSLHIARSFNQNMQTLYSSERTPEETAILRFHDELVPKLEKLLEKMKSMVRDEEEYLKFVHVLESSYANGKYGINLGGISE